MTIFLHILLTNIVPMSIVIGLGIILQKAFSLDIKTLSKLNFYLFSPAFMFQLLYTTEISGSLVGQTLLFLLLFMFLQYIVIEIIVRLRGYKPSMSSSMRNSVLFYNSANYGIPLNQLAFAGNPLTLAVQVIIMMTQSLIPNTYGIYNVNAHKADMKQVWKTIFSMPIIYVIPVALSLRGFNVAIPQPVMVPIEYLYNAFIGTALITLGVQLGNMNWKIKKEQIIDVSISNVLRLIVGPLLAAFVVFLVDLAVGLEPIVAAALIVSSAVPTSLSSVLLAVEFDNEPEFASQSVFFSTLFSIITVTVVIFLVQMNG
ncbi:AEC family transporter [Paenibacillus yanchengensis]|uniref:AEC family transporter n=1 Tax=Paenibacillus yanchengensis TaxID=2035833 RepID=A0ABW4YM03_9BACL